MTERWTKPLALHRCTRPAARTRRSVARRHEMHELEVEGQRPAHETQVGQKIGHDGARVIERPQISSHEFLHVRPPCA